MENSFQKKKMQFKLYFCPPAPPPPPQQKYLKATLMEEYEGGSPIYQSVTLN